MDRLNILPKSKVWPTNPMIMDLTLQTGLKNLGYIVYEAAADHTATQLGGVEALQPYERKKYATRIKSIFIQSVCVIRVAGLFS